MEYGRLGRDSSWFWEKIVFIFDEKMAKLTYRTIGKESQFEIAKIKWSRFLTYLFPCEDKQNATNLLENVKKEHFSATHHCSARRVGIRVHEDLFGNVLIDPFHSKANDDWEPTNTAGKPILSVLEWEKILNVLCVVVRYFGGTLLWVWWLIQAYSTATKEALINAEIIEKEILKEFALTHEYNQTALIAHLIEKYGIKLVSEICEEKTKKILTINQGLFSDFEKELFEASNGSLRVEKTKKPEIESD